MPEVGFKISCSSQAGINLAQPEIPVGPDKGLQ